MSQSVAERTASYLFQATHADGIRGVAHGSAYELTLAAILGCVLVLGVVAWGSAAQAETAYTYADLVARLMDLEHLAQLPLPGERCAQWSSYDRASRYDEKSGKYVHWDANGDGGHFIRREGDQVVMAEMEGPGCIWRIWSARAEKGHVKIYLDGQDRPALDLPFASYFDGKTPPLAYPMLSYDLNQLGSSGQNLYLPIPYQKSCKIVAEKGWGAYYHFVYQTFPRGTRVPTFSAALAAENKAALARVNDFFATKLGTDPKGQRPGQLEQAGVHRVEAGKTVTVAEFSGPAAITAIRAKVADRFKDREEQMAALRCLVLRITWDGQQKPAVWCPLGDFFGTAPGENYYRTLATGMTPEGYYALWYMPFAQSARVELANEDSQARTVKFQITTAPLGRPFEGLGYFHAKWHRDTFALPADRWPDWVMLRTQGRGRFCGVMLHVWNPRGGWWGEGDEKFFVDGEKFPSTFGTGSEDYFGYAWGHPGLFQRPFHAQTMTQKNRGHQSVLRWHIVDNVPFQTAFEACIEKYFRNEDRGTLYACLPVWYLAPGGTDPYEPVPVSQRHGYYQRIVASAGGFQVLGDPPGNVETQHMQPFRGKWDRNDQLWWTEAKPGDRLELALAVSKAGRYHVRAVLTKARDYAIVRFYLDGQPAGQPVDLYNPEVVPTDPPVSLGIHELSAGQHKLTVEIVGANPKAIKAYMFGLDRILLEPSGP